MTKTMHFRASFCDPLQKEVIELGPIPKDRIVEKFEQTPWDDYLHKMELAPEDGIHYSPSLEIENADTRHGLSFSAVGSPGNFEFYIFYKRPKRVKAFFGLIKTQRDHYTTDKTGQTWQDALDCLEALIRNDTDYLANKIGR